MTESEKKWSRKIPFSTSWRDARRANKTPIQQPTPPVPVAPADPEPTIIYPDDPPPPYYPGPASTWTSPPPPRRPHPEMPILRSRPTASWVGIPSQQLGARVGAVWT
ncbi:hypothetical protein V495_00701 [Pseudogymnoascus sp. VKM F-4514 (FW-929)]|nr:hypothetical protein V495_00701 [Pseudogymnoascus sp. VKM F-4514 (FW-929)]KFY65774.1 hypothetical protein V497_01278 [Pseudogymnoascus sp. VKM F-4516 (FW-969)]